MESNSLEKFPNNSVASRFIAHIPLPIRRIVIICKVVERFMFGVRCILTHIKRTHIYAWLYTECERERERNLERTKESRNQLSTLENICVRVYIYMSVCICIRVHARTHTHTHRIHIEYTQKSIHIDQRSS